MFRILRIFCDSPLQPTEMLSPMPTSFLAPKIATKPNLESRPPYVVETHLCETTTYGGIFEPRKSFDFTKGF